MNAEDRQIYQAKYTAAFHNPHYDSTSFYCYVRAIVALTL